MRIVMVFFMCNTSGTRWCNESI